MTTALGRVFALYFFTFWLMAASTKIIMAFMP